MEIYYFQTNNFNEFQRIIYLNYFKCQLFQMDTLYVNYFKWILSISNGYSLIQIDINSNRYFLIFVFKFKTLESTDKSGTLFHLYNNTLSLYIIICI